MSQFVQASEWVYVGRTRHQFRHRRHRFWKSIQAFTPSPKRRVQLQERGLEDGDILLINPDADFDLTAIPRDFQYPAMLSNTELTDEQLRVLVAGLVIRVHGQIKPDTRLI